LFNSFTAICNSSSDSAIITWSSAYNIVLIIFLDASWMPLRVVCFHSFIALLMYMLNRSGDSPHPCLTPLLVLIGCAICPSLYFILIFGFWYRLCMVFSSSVGMSSSLKICHSFPQFKLPCFYIVDKKNKCW
jgi:hypothetical protein